MGDWRGEMLARIRRLLHAAPENTTTGQRRPLSARTAAAKSATLPNAPATELAATPTPAPTIAPVSPPPASGSKQARLVGLLRRAEGATITELMAATGWISHSVRGALSAVVKRKLGLVVNSQLETDRGRVYRIATPHPTPTKRARRAKVKDSTAEPVAA